MSLLNAATRANTSYLSHLCTYTLPRVSTRHFHKSPISQDFFNWIKERSKERAKKRQEAEKQKSTKDVMSEIEAGKEVEDSGSVTTLELIPENFIGTFDKARHTIPLETVPFNEWLPKVKVTTEEGLNEVLVKSYNQVYDTNVSTVSDDKLSLPFTDLQKKFEFCKAIQQGLGYMISDYQLTVLQTPIAFRDYCLVELISGKLARFNEKEPNAIHLTNESYTAPNIRVMEDVSVRERKEGFESILAEVNEMERVAREKAIEEARRS